LSNMSAASCQALQTSADKPGAWYSWKYIFEYQYFTYRITAIIKVETDIIDSISVKSDRSDGISRELHW
jgi:hypothetical protein